MSQPPCDRCTARCCKLDVHGFNNVAGELFFTPNCPHLTAENQCAIYERRPDACRKFDCRRDAPEIAPAVDALKGGQ